MNEILVYTMQDCNDLCGILARNGYCTTAYQLVTATSNECFPKQWSVKYYDPNKIETIESKTSPIKLSKRSMEILENKKKE